MEVDFQNTHTEKKNGNEILAPCHLLVRICAKRKYRRHTYWMVLQNYVNIWSKMLNSWKDQLGLSLTPIKKFLAI